jgi:hypothetical protein
VPPQTDEATTCPHDQHAGIWRRVLGKQQRGHALHVEQPGHQTRRPRGVVADGLRIREELRHG